MARTFNDIGLSVDFSQPFGADLSSLSKNDLMSFFYSENWARAGQIEGAREQILQEVSNRICDAEGIEHTPVYVSGSMADNVYGGYCGDKIQLNEKYLDDPYQALDSIAHETEHHFQASPYTGEKFDYQEKAIIKAENTGPGYCNHGEYYDVQRLEMDSNNAGFEYVTANHEMFKNDPAYQAYLSERAAHFNNVINTMDSAPQEFDDIEKSYINNAYNAGLISENERNDAFAGIESGNDSIEREYRQNAEKAMELRDSLSESDTMSAADDGNQETVPEAEDSYQPVYTGHEPGETAGETPEEDTESRDPGTAGESLDGEETYGAEQVRETQDDDIEILDFDEESGSGEEDGEEDKDLDKLENQEAQESEDEEIEMLDFGDEEASSGEENIDEAADEIEGDEETAEDIADGMEQDSETSETAEENAGEDIEMLDLDEESESGEQESADEDEALESGDGESEAPDLEDGSAEGREDAYAPDYEDGGESSENTEDDENAYSGDEAAPEESEDLDEAYNSAEDVQTGDNAPDEDLDNGYEADAYPEENTEDAEDYEDLDGEAPETESEETDDPENLNSTEGYAVDGDYGESYDPDEDLDYTGEESGEGETGEEAYSAGEDLDTAEQVDNEPAESTYASDSGLESESSDESEGMSE